MTVSTESQRSLEEVVNDPNTDPATFDEAARRLQKLRDLHAGK